MKWLKNFKIGLLFICMSFLYGKSQSGYTLLSANLSGTELEKFPVLMQLNEENYDFSAANENGANLVFYDQKNEKLKYAVHSFDKTKKQGKFWLQIPRIGGNANSFPLTIKNESSSPANLRGLDKVYDTGFIGYWNFDGTLSNATSGSIVGNATQTSSTGGVFGNAQQFPNTGGHIDFGTSSLLNFGENKDFSIEFWIKTGLNTGDDPCVLSNKDWANGQNKGFVIFLEDGTIQANVGDGTNRTDVAGGFVADNKWHYVVVSFDRDQNLVLYVDGVEKEKKSITAIENIHSGLPLVMGNDGTKNYSKVFTGSLDELGIMDFAMTASGVQVRYESMTSPMSTSSGLKKIHGIEHVMVIGIDGLGSENILQQAKPNVPNINVLKESGAWAFSTKIDPLNFSGPNWAGMVTGSGSYVHKITTNNCVKTSVPTIYEVLRWQEPNAKIGRVFEWDKIGCYETTTSNDYKVNSTLETTVEEVVKYLGNEKPDFLFVHFDRVDYAGHQHGGSSSQYKSTVESVDTNIGLILKGLDSLGMRENTLIIVTADHGHHPTSGKHASSEKPVPFIVNGPGVITGEIEGQVENRYVAWVVAHAMGISGHATWEKPNMDVSTFFEKVEPDTGTGGDSGQVYLSTPANKMQFSIKNKNLFIEGEQEGLQVVLRKVNGQEVYSLKQNDNNNSWNLKFVPSGNYILFVHRGEEMFNAPVNIR